jgi:hypothetical protein
MPNVNAIRLLSSDEFCDSVRVCPAYRSLFLTFECFKETKSLGIASRDPCELSRRYSDRFEIGVK